ncbi:HIRAN domain-containing protein [Sediminibacterium sp.]|uniref:HIRAN domain-containing protein n=1 Tax=Sediminibacterium sp. TaxID=1917865 RepID=UPI0025ED0F27|nr:HIRAN domain-containing protein [Sediminibacterium sp.]MBT9485569.1 HIRAN domain-containing protein [Sediminibacterium sp.]
MMEFEKIYLVWRKGKGTRRHAIGVLEKTPDGKNLFHYLPVALELVKEEGFTPYTEFQDMTKSYNGNVAEIFGQRLTKSDRSDISNFYKFWEVDPERASDKFYLLGKTQGLVPTDNFEFLADYIFQPKVHFLTELAGLSKYNLPKETLKTGDLLRFEKDIENPYDKFAVKVFKGNTEIGYIKKYHSKIFYEPGAEKLKLQVKAVEENGILKRAFLKVYL